MATRACIVEQFGFAIIPFLGFLAVSGFTSGITSGTSLSILNALLLSTTVIPLDAAMGEYFLLMSPPAEKRAISMSLSKASSQSSSTT